MPLSKEHKRQSREKIVQSASELFTELGFDQVTIDDVMNRAGMTRGAFYGHFASKTALFVEVVSHGTYIDGGTHWAALAGDGHRLYSKLVDAYLSDHHLQNTTGACPLIAFPDGVARGDDDLRDAYTNVAKSISAAFGRALGADWRSPKALATLATVVGAMVIARATNSSELAAAIRTASFNSCVGGVDANAFGESTLLDTQ